MSQKSGFMSSEWFKLKMGPLNVRSFEIPFNKNLYDGLFIGVLHISVAQWVEIFKPHLLNIVMITYYSFHRRTTTTQTLIKQQILYTKKRFTIFYLTL